MRKIWLAAVMGWAMAAQGQWVLQESGTKASFRGVDYVGNGVAWVSGTGGTVLRTVDMGKTWVKCAVPEGAETLDFRGVQAWDAKTAIVMSSGPGNLSRLYKTVDECATWKLVFLDPDKDGFFDAIRFVDKTEGYLVGDPVGGAWSEFHTQDGGATWIKEEEVKDALPSLPGSGQPPQPIFAASNSSLQFESMQHLPDRWVATGGKQGGAVYVGTLPCGMGMFQEEREHCTYSRIWQRTQVFPSSNGEGAGVFSIGLRVESRGRTSTQMGVAVGGDYEKPDARENTAAYVHVTAGWNHALTWHVSSTMPGGYRSAVQYHSKEGAWITVGPNGTDVSQDDGKNWIALRPGPGDAADADKRWNALSLPFVVGEKGRIGILRDGVLNSAAKSAKDAKVSPR